VSPSGFRRRGQIAVYKNGRFIDEWTSIAIVSLTKTGDIAVNCDEKKWWPISNVRLLGVAVWFNCLPRGGGRGFR